MARASRTDDEEKENPVMNGITNMMKRESCVQNRAGKLDYRMQLCQRQSCMQISLIFIKCLRNITIYIFSLLIIIYKRLIPELTTNLNCFVWLLFN